MGDETLKKEGKIVGRYVLHQEIAAGGMATVHLGRLLGSVSFSRTVAIKRLHTQFANDADFVSMFVDEARVAARIRHPNVVSTLDVVASDGELFVVMEYIPGEPLSRLLRVVTGRGQRIPLRIVSSIVCDVLHGLHAAHEAKDEQGNPLGIVHRDVSPQNVLVGTDGAARLLDFGVAKAVHRVQTTRDGQLKGKLSYMAPEQITAGKSHRSSDIYAASVVFWEAIAGRRLFTSDNDGELVAKVIASNIQAPSLALEGTLDPEERAAYAALDAIILKGLARRPDDRYATAREMAMELDSCITPASRAEVGEWVEETAADVLNERAKLIADLESGVSAPHSTPQEILQAIRSAPPSSSSSISSISSLGPIAEPPTRADAYLSKPPVASPQGRPVALRALAAVAAVVAIVGTTVSLTRRASAPSATDTATTPAPSAVPAPAGPRIITDWSAPEGTRADAAAAYRAGLQALRDGSLDLALQNFEKATTSDPGMAGAFLRLSIADSTIVQDEVATRRSFAKAVQLRPSLTPRDQVILDAFEPYLQREPSDLAEAERRLQAAVTHDPIDSEIQLYLGLTQFWSGRLDAAKVTLAAATAVDPKLASALAYKGAAEAYGGDLAAARRTLDGCVEGSPSATECLFYRMSLEEQGGECAREEADAKLWIARDPEDFYGYQLLAQALAGEGRALPAVRLAYEQKWSKMYAQNRPAREPLDRAHLDILAGDFVAAEAHLKEASNAAGSADPGQTSHAAPASLLADIYRETGRLPLARRVADEYLSSGDVWVPPPTADDAIMSADPVPRMLAIQLQAGELTRPEFEAKRRTWLDAWRKRTSGAYGHFLWIYAYGEPTTTREDALAALGALPEYAPVPEFTPQSAATGLVGKVYWLAGRTEEAVVTLKKATASCIALMEPMQHTHAHLYLGEALEAKGDRDGACAAYTVVRDRWGASKPASVTAQQAARRSAALACKPSP
jgi:serine/threonine-protein kinase